MTRASLELHLPDEAATQVLGEALARAIASEYRISGTAPTLYCSGDLGAGKTTLIRALLRALGVTGRIKSPTYALVEPYEITLDEIKLAESVLKMAQPGTATLETRPKLSLYSQLQCYHFDFYRFTDAREWLEAGFREYFNPQSLCLVEWPEKAGPTLPSADLQIYLSLANDDGRTAQVRAHTPRGIDCLNHAAAFLKPA